MTIHSISIDLRLRGALVQIIAEIELRRGSQPRLRQRKILHIARPAEARREWKGVLTPEEERYISANVLSALAPGT